MRRDPSGIQPEDGLQRRGWSDAYLRADGDDRLDVRDVIARDLRDMKEARHAAHVNERAVRLHGGHNALEDRADREVVDLRVDDRLAVRDDEAGRLLVDVEELDL